MFGKSKQNVLKWYHSAFPLRRGICKVLLVDFLKKCLFWNTFLTLPRLTILCIRLCDLGSVKGCYKKGCHLQFRGQASSCPAARAQPRDLASLSQAGGHGCCFPAQPAATSTAPMCRTHTSTDSQVPFSPSAVRAEVH